MWCLLYSKCMSSYGLRIYVVFAVFKVHGFVRTEDLCGVCRIQSAWLHTDWGLMWCLLNSKCMASYGLWIYVVFAVFKVHGFIQYEDLCDVCCIQSARIHLG